MEPNLDALKQELLAEFDRVGEMLAAEGCDVNVALEFRSTGIEYLLWWRRKQIGIGGSPDYFDSNRSYDHRVILDGAMAIGKLIDKARAEKVTAEKMQAAIDHLKHLRGEPRVVEFVNAPIPLLPRDALAMASIVAQVFPSMSREEWAKITAVAYEHGQDSVASYVRAAELAFPSIKFVPAEELSK